MFKSETTSFHYFSPKDSESLKNLDIRLWKVGAQRRLNGTSKVNTRTDGHTDRRTFQLIESIGPEGQCFEKLGMGIPNHACLEARELVHDICCHV